MSDSLHPFRRPKRPGSQSRRSKAKSREKTLDDNLLMAQLQTKSAQPDLFEAPAIGFDYSGTCIHAVNGVELVADAQGVAYWPAEQTLLVADLHLEKGSSFARRGQLLPPYDTMTTLNRLSALLQKWQPERVIALGDSFHDREASARLALQAMDLLTASMAGRDWVWITGNHDPEPPLDPNGKALGGTVVEELHLAGLILRHEPQLAAAAGEIAGHLHPKARIVRRGRSVRRSCFAASRTRMILPSFGAYTGGLNVFDRAFDGLFEDRQFHALMRGDDQVYRIAADDLS